MLASQRQEGPGGGDFRTPPGLLAWQVYFLSYVAGVWGLAQPQPALASAGLLWAGLMLFRRPGLMRGLAALLLTAACFAAGGLMARRALPDIPQAPAILHESRAKAKITARVAELIDKPSGRVELVLEDVRALLPPPKERRGEDAADENAPEPAPEEVAVPGRVSFDWDNATLRPAPGQRLEASLRLRPVHGFLNAGGSDFEWRERLRGVFFRAYARGDEAGVVLGPRPGNLAWDLREDLRERLLRLLPPGQGGAIVLGLLLGERSRIDQTVTEELRAAGLSHTLALSGLNVVYVAVLGAGLAWLAGLLRPGIYLRLPRQKLAVLFSLPLVAAYVWVGQASPSLVRSAWMFAFWGLLILMDRGRVLVDGLFLALLVMVGLDPLCVFDLGLQMSAAAVAGLCFLEPWLSGLMPRLPGLPGRMLRWVWEGLAMTVAATLSLIPITVWTFGTFAPNFLLNLPWLPVQGLVVQVLGMVGLALAPLPGLEGLAGWLLGLASLAQDWMLDVLHWLALRGAFPTWALLRPLWPELLGCALVLCAAPFCRPGRGQTSHRALALLFCGLFLCALPQAELLRDEYRDEVRLSVLDVGQAQALVVTAPGGRRVLVDGGGVFSPNFDIGRSVVGPALSWGRPPRLDAALFSHPDLDHAQGLVWIARSFELGAFHTNGRWPEGRLGADLSAALEQGSGFTPRPLAAGDRLDLGSGVSLEVLHPAEGYDGHGTNDNSLVLRLAWRGVGLAILPGDVQRDGIEDMLGRGRDFQAQVLVLPHHGSKSSLSGLLYEAVAPALAIASCGFQNMYRFPNKDVRAELDARGVPLVSTSERGMLELVWRAPGLAPEMSAQRD